MVAKNEKGESVSVPGIILENDEDIRRFLTSIKRQELKSAKTSELKGIDFHSKEYLDQLKEYNVKVL